MLAGTIMAMASCSDDIMVREETDITDNTVGLTFRCTDMLEVYRGQNNDATRAGGSKSAEEKKIKTLHVFFFGKDDELLVPNYQTFPSYQKINIEGESELAFIKIPSDKYQGTSGEGYVGLFRDKNNQPANDGIRVVAIANIDATDEAEGDPTNEANSFYTSYSSGKIQMEGRNKGGEPYKIERYSDLVKWIYYPKIRMNDENCDISKLPDAGMPMIGESTTRINVTKKPDKPDVINMRALMAKVNISVKLDPDQFTNNLPSLTITEYGIMNMPIAVPFKDPKGEPVTTGKWIKPKSLQEYFDAYDVTKQPMFHKEGNNSNWNEDHNECSPESHEYTNKINPIKIHKDSSPVVFSYYTFENINMPNYSAERSGNFDQNDNNRFAFKPFIDNSATVFEPNYPSGVGEADRERWKPTIAYKDRASALILKGEYTTHQGLTYQAQFTFYLGMDNEIDFKVKRNHQYDNNIVIEGLNYVRNSVDDVYTFDGRVNVKYDNPLYLAIVNERNLDAHASALPMDIWLLDQENSEEPIDYNTDITFEIPQNAQSWMQMVFIPREEMADNPNDPKSRFYAGTGIEPYFYENLLEDIRNKEVLTPNSKGGIGYPGHKVKEINGLQYGAQCGSKFTVRSTPDINNSRSRIYFYIEENTKDFKYDGTYCTGTSDRTAAIKVHYKSYRLKDGSLTDTLNVLSERFRTIEIQQRGLRRVKNQWVSSKTFLGYTEKDIIPETFIEYNEEYLNHNDPLDEHVSGDVYSGLEWGLNGTKITFNNNYEGIGGSAVILYKGEAACAMTRWAIDNTKVNGRDRMIDVHLFDKDSKPYSAFHYCFGKNKRNYDGTVAEEGNYGWYLPGIRELETAIVQYYETFEDFQNKFYWSAACTSSNYYARATKVSVDRNGKAQYVDSQYSSNEGYKPRTGDDAKLRIRAFYRRK